MSYRSKGGKFVVKNDLLKIYGIDSSIYHKLYAFIDLPKKIKKENRVESFIPKEERKIEPFDLNKADTTELKKIYGIGSKLSRRIVTYREKLGGFITTRQLKEVYGLDSVVVNDLTRESFIDTNFHPYQININKATEKDLSTHPYIKYKLAKAIIVYRFQHGSFQSIDELKKMALMDESKFQQIKPYLSINP